MTLRNGEYEINDDKITIPKKVLEEWRDHYGKVSSSYVNGGNLLISWFYMGKRDVLVDLLKMFDELEAL